MTKRYRFLIALFVVTACGAYLYHRNAKWSATGDPFGLAPVVQEPDAFDRPYISDPQLVKEFADQKIDFPFKPGDRVAWIGSSSTFIGEWCKTEEFLLRSRHPELNLTFARQSTGGGTFASGATRLPEWLAHSKPTLVVFNYGANDAASGKKRLDEFRTAMKRDIELAQKAGARVLLLAPQSGDIRATGSAQFYRRRHFADEMLALSKANHWTLVDVYHPLDDLQTKGQARANDFSINYDHIHLTDSAYAAWGFYLYERLNPPPAESLLEIDAASGKIVASKNCTAQITSTGAELTFEREDSVLPILPPDPLPPSRTLHGKTPAKHGAAQASEYAQSHGEDLPSRELVPMESNSRYMLKITGLAPGSYALECNKQAVGSATEKEFAQGVNVNSLLLNANLPAPWKDLAQKIWDGTTLNDLADRKLVFKLKKQ